MAEVSLKTFGDPDDKTLQTMVITVICLGCVIFIVGFLGFCGACMKNVCMLITYSVILGVLSLAEVACGIAGLVLRDQVKCCGPNGVWTSGAMPESCYNSDGTQNTAGCVDSMNKLIQGNLVALGICVFIFALVQIICMIFALCVVNALQKGESETV
ncbi:CD63 antigen [Paragonimus westermani]|uniref:CD63 antigen n=1 Tax=Paragonimus westermani TaxID=34504 RepID=A0A5J4NR27_9TREM|nr:CD63 antigen [Paragonimus westermani]